MTGDSKHEIDLSFNKELTSSSGEKEKGGIFKLERWEDTMSKGGL